MRSMQIKENYEEELPERGSRFEMKDDFFVSGGNRNYSYVNARKYDGEENMGRDYNYKNDNIVGRNRPYISKEDTAAEREKRLTAHSMLYANRYAQRQREAEAQRGAQLKTENLKASDLRSNYRLSDINSNSSDLRMSDLRSEASDSRVSTMRPESRQATEIYQEERIDEKSLPDEIPQTSEFDYNREYDSSPYTYNRNKIDNDAYQRTYYTENAPVFKPTSKVYGNATTIADRYKKLFSEKEQELQPSGKTMQYAENKPNEKVKEFKLEKEASTATRTSAKKGLITLYVTIIVVIAVLIATTGIMISTLSQDINALQAEVNANQSYIATQNAKLSKYDDEDYIFGKAKNQGMDENEQTYFVELIPVDIQAKTNADSNWFDNLCDWLSDVFGR